MPRGRAATSRVAGDGARGIAALVTEIRAEVAACRLCPGMKPWKKPPPESFGTSATGLVLVGDVPGMGPRPFDDKKGRVVRQALADVGHPRVRELEDLFYVTHAVRCAPRHRTDATRSRPPARAECRTCRPYLWFELRALHPKLVVTFGALAAEAALGDPVKMADVHGKRHRRRAGEVVTLLWPTASPALKQQGLDVPKYRERLTEFFAGLLG